MKLQTVCIRHEPPGLSGEAGWTFRRAGAVTSIEVQGRVQVASAEGVVACAKAGLGVAIASQWMCWAELERGELERILRDDELDPVEVHAVYPAGRRPSPKVRAFSDHLASQVGAKVEAEAGQ